MLGAIQRSNLHSLALGYEEEDYLVAILSALRSHHSLKKLVLSPDDWSDAEDQAFQKFMRTTTTLEELEFTNADRWTRQELLRVAKSNFSLRAFTARGWQIDGHHETLVDFFHEDDRRVLRSYFDRNERVSQFIDSPATVPTNLWPQVFGVVSSDPSLLFQSFKTSSAKLLGSDQQRKRKRKRPDYFKP